MRLRNALARLAGARPEILEKAPGDLTKYAVMGGVLLSTAGLAGVAAYFALASTLGLTVWLALVSAVVWFGVVLNLDQLLVVTLNTTSKRRALLVAVPRVLMAAVIGAVVATPLVLRIFQPEINAELQYMQAEAVTRVQAKLDEAYRQIESLEQQERELQDAMAGRNSSAVSTDPDVKAAQENYDKAQTAYLQAESEAQCELDGSCGTGRPGVGDSYREKREAADRAREVRDDAKTKLDNVVAEVTTRNQHSSSAAADDARTKIDGVRADLAAAQERKRQAERQALDAQQLNTGLLARLEALDRLTDGRPSASAARWALGMLFFLIEILPVVTKLLTMFGSATLYDRVLQRHDDELDRKDQLKSETKRHAAQADADAAALLSKQQADARVQAGQAAIDELTKQQSQIALNAVRTWAEVAKLRSDEQLHEWYRTHVGTVVQPATRPPSPAVTTPLPVLAVPAHDANEVTTPLPAYRPVNGSGPAPQNHRP